MGRSKTKRRVRRNPLTTKQKLLTVGGLAVVGGVAAYALTRPTSPTTGGGSAATGPAAAQCDALQAQLIAMRAGARPDPAAMQRLEAQIQTCIQQVRAAGGDVDNATSNLSSGDTKFQHIEDQFADYKRTEYSDALKRNNVRQDILNTGASMATDYANAVNAATTPVTTRAVRQSILRALDAAVLRRLCYLYDMPGCGRFAVNEDHGNDKAGQEYTRIIKPLLDAQGAAVQKLWSIGGDATSDNAAFFATQLRPCAALNDYVNAKFAEYKGVDYSDPLRRNNLRVNEVLGKGGDLVACLQGVVGDAIGYRSLVGLRAATLVVKSALDSAVTRWICYITAAPGCDRFGVNEDHSNDKAGQEYERIIAPLSALYMDAAAKLVQWGDVTAYEPLITIKLRRCTALNDYATAKFNEYKSVDYSDAVRRNNLRQVVLAIGALLAGCLQDAMSAALTGAAARPGSLIARAAMTVGTTGLRTGLAPLLLGSGTSATTSPAGTSGLGLTLVAPSTLGLKLNTAAPVSTTSTSTPPAPVDTAVQGAIDAGVRMVKAVMVVAKTALDAAITRQLCYLYDQPGCGRFAVNEDAGVDKAGQEYSATVAPIMGVVAQGTTFLVGTGDPKAETALISSKLRYCTALNDYVNTKFNEYKSVSWSDAVRRNNLRVGEVLGKGRDLVTCLRNTAPTTALGRAMVKTLVDSALAASRARVACYNDPSSPCGRFGGNEDDNATKAAQETADITNPLADLSSRLASGAPLSGLGLVIDSGTWFNIGAAAVIGGVLYMSTRSRGRSRKNTSRRHRRTSRRAR